MPRDKTVSHEKIVIAAKEEFMEYGFKDASMRRIGTKVDMSAAALYRHFESKEAMFDALVKPAVDDLYEWLDLHMKRSYNALENDHNELWNDTQIDLMKELILPRMEEYHLLLARAQGSKYENFLHDLVLYQQEEMFPVFEKLRETGFPAKEITEEELHLLLSAYNTALLEPVIHMYPRDKAMKSLEVVEIFFMPGWKAIMGF